MMNTLAIFGLGTPEIISILVIVFPALFLVIFLVVWRFHRFAVRRLAEQQKQEQESSDDA